MKNKIFFLLSTILVSTIATAQFRIGVKAGANIVKINAISFQDQFSYGYHAGAFLDVDLIPKKLSLQPEVLLSQYTTTVSNDYTTVYQNVISSSQLKVKLNYLTFPVLLNYKFIGPLHLQAGPQYGILSDQTKTLLQNGQNAFKKGEFSMVGGAEIRLTKIYLTGRYIVGLSNINDIDNKDKWKSQLIQISMGITL